MRSGVLALVAGAALAVAGCSQVNAQKGPPEYRYGFGYAYGPGAVMGAPGYGPMMGGQGYGPMMGAPGYGPMMGGGYGPMMGRGAGTLPNDLTAEQREKIAAIQGEFRAKQWPLMQQMHELMWNSPADDQGQRRNYDAVAALQKQMFENMLDQRKRIDDVVGAKR